MVQAFVDFIDEYKLLRAEGVKSVRDSRYRVEVLREEPDEYPEVREPEQHPISNRPWRVAVLQQAKRERVPALAIAVEVVTTVRPNPDKRAAPTYMSAAYRLVIVNPQLERIMDVCMWPKDRLKSTYWRTLRRTNVEENTE